MDSRIGRHAADQAAAYGSLTRVEIDELYQLLSFMTGKDQTVLTAMIADAELLRIAAMSAIKKGDSRDGL